MTNSKQLGLRSIGYCYTTELILKVPPLPTTELILKVPPLPTTELILKVPPLPTTELILNVPLLTWCYFWKFTEVKFQDILLTGTRHRDKRLNRESPCQTRTYGRSNLNQNLNLTSGSFVKDHLLFLLFTKSAGPPKSAAPGHFSPRPRPCRGPGLISLKHSVSGVVFSSWEKPEDC